MSERGAPDYTVATIVLWLASGVSVARKAGVNWETMERCRLVADEMYQAIAVRGARVGEIVEALRSVRRGASILDDLPTVREKPPTGRG